jgi:enoyl-CoA hydratase/carnithine racemase
VAALNGHTVAGGCMLATACDVRLMVSGKAKMALNEITFGSSMPSHTLELLRYWVGSRRAETILLSGALYDPEEAQALGLVDKVVAPEDLPATARHVAREMAQKDPAAFRSLKRLLRQPTLNAIAAAAPDSLRDFLDLWYSESTRQQLQETKIHS